MKMPRDVSGAELGRILANVGYRVTRQTGSHIRLTREDDQQHHLTIPNHNPLKIGTLSAIVADVAMQLGISKNEAIRRLFGQ